MVKFFKQHFHPLARLDRERTKVDQHPTMPKILTQLITELEFNLDTEMKEMEYLVLDLETTGLHAESDLILSIGWLSISNNKIDLGKAVHLYIDEESQIDPETAVINHITPQMLKEGVPLHDAMYMLFEAAKGKVIVAHACSVEKAFIDHYIQQHFGLLPLPIVWLDTLAIEKKMAASRNNHDIDLSLSQTRARYQLPEYNNHDALIDALATAELLLAQSKRLSPQKSVSLAKLYRLSH